ncbi:MAG: nitrite reductase large subunit [Variovorax sp.]|nr:nitrite reductase large subunit [Variovorax sp.]
MKKMKLVLVGNGPAGARTLEELLKLAPELYDITVFGADPQPEGHRLPGGPAGGPTAEETAASPFRQWCRDHDIVLHTGKKVVEVDRLRRIVRAADGTEAAYDRLLMCTGSLPFLLPVPGRDLEGVLAYHDSADTRAIHEAAETFRNAVVIGGGLPGLEVASGLLMRGMRVSVVHAANWLMDGQLDDVAGGLLRQALEARGMRFLMNARTQALVGDRYDGFGGRVKAVRFQDGGEVPADLVVMAVGIRPNVELARRMRLHCEHGIVVNDTLQTITDARIYAVGECAAHRGIAYGRAALDEQARVAANHLAQVGIGRYLGSPTSAQLKVTGIELFAVGDVMGGEGTETLVMSDPFSGVYKKLVLRGDKLVGACLYGDTGDGSWYLKLLRDSRGIGNIREQLMAGHDKVTAQPDDPSAQGRFAHASSHARLEQDGSCRITLPLADGHISSAQLRRIADVADRYALPAARIADDRSIELPGIGRADLEAVWHDLGLPPGQVCMEALRMAETCRSDD